MRYIRTGGNGCFVHNQDAVELLDFGIPALDGIERATMTDVAINCFEKPDDTEYRGFGSVMVIYNRLIDNNGLHDRAVAFAKRLPKNLLRDMLGGVYLVIGCAKPKRKLPDSYCALLEWIQSNPQLAGDSDVARSIRQIVTNCTNTRIKPDA